MTFSTISVIGLGYIGLPTAAMFAAYGKKVIGVDVNVETVNTINGGGIHFVEPELDAIVQNVVSNGSLRAVVKPEPAEAFLIAVPTPFIPDQSTGGRPEADLNYIREASIAISAVLKKGDLVILESTSPVGTTEKMADWLAQCRKDLTFPATHGEQADIRIAHCPERVLPGRVVIELVENDRVIGGLTEKCSLLARDLYKVFVRGECYLTNARTAEMAKLTENAFRDVNIAFANELSMICDEINVDVWELIRLANRHPRVDILKPGPGVGGHCIAVDPWFIVSKTPEQAKLIHTARKINDAKPSWGIEKIKNSVIEFLKNNIDRSVKDIVIACYGITFKPDIDDLRESPALDIALTISTLHPGEVLTVEPNINKKSIKDNRINLVDLQFAINKADIHIILVDHKEFLSLRLEQLHGKTVIDIKGVLSQ